MKSVFEMMYGGYEWTELRVYKHPANGRKYVVDTQTGCSCYSYEELTEETLRACEPLTKVQARKEVADWAENNCSWDGIADKATERVKVIEAFNQEVK